MLRRFMKGRAFQVSLVDSNPRTHNDPYAQPEPSAEEAILMAQNAVIQTAVAIGGVVAGVIVVKTACAISLEIAKKVIN